MYERFTDRARKVMQLAKQEAHRFNHEYIGTEHILLGLVREGTGVAAEVLKNLNVDLRTIRVEVEKIVQPSPGMNEMGMAKLPQTPRAKRVVEFAIEEARNLNHNYVGSEHLLLGLIREREGVASQVLMNLGLDVTKIRDEILKLVDSTVLPRTPAPGTSGWLSEPDAIRTALGPLEAEIERLAAAKLAAVAEQDFKEAAFLRDEEAKAKKKRAAMLRGTKAIEPRLLREYELLLTLQNAARMSLPDEAVAEVRKRLHERFEGFLETRLRVDGAWHVGPAVLRGELVSFRLLAEVMSYPRDFFLELRRDLAEDFGWRGVAIIERPVEVL